ncbi:hypothetical protein HALLA_09580 [Halostagnicola larsenii XH-48]|uniref:Uncharacterized protein n=1 Tax=Halostagnicola larsenii XH-48 TaxID=797299 RepID=W0JUD1_9EURY|nr:hypothetical protein [Halostagnicola larsenii]AHG00826.1 hypothetical protein HALLA_09415 [Halostagnicola larsenii XH-48]AHG00845.1 hypothetical protein HALLA_09580 [Halostagnicola larsenii XH-48]
MATLPDIDDSAVSIMAWWNALEAGATSIDPVDAIDYQPIDSWEPYDNGVTGQLTDSIGGNTIHFRVKTDGWVVVWIETDDPIDEDRILKDRDNFSTGPRPVRHNRLKDHIENIREQLGNPGEFVASDVGLYFYDYPDATHLGLWKLDNTNDSATQTAAVSLTDTSELHNLIGIGAVEIENESSGVGYTGGTSIRFNGTTVLSYSTELRDDEDPRSTWDRADLATDQLDKYVFYEFSVANSTEQHDVRVDAQGTLFAFYEIPEESA